MNLLKWFEDLNSDGIEVHLPPLLLFFLKTAFFSSLVLINKKISSINNNHMYQYKHKLKCKNKYIH